MPSYPGFYEQKAIKQSSVLWALLSDVSHVLRRRLGSFDNQEGMLSTGRLSGAGGVTGITGSLLPR